jgi:hypothetical protein
MPGAHHHLRLEADNGRPARGSARALEVAWWGYEHLPRGTEPTIHAVQRYGMPLLRPRITLRRVQGTTPNGHPASALVAGSGAAIDYLLRRFFASTSEAEPLGRVLLFALPSALRRHAADDLILARVGRAIAGWLFDHRYFRVPEAVDARLAIDQMDTLANANRSVQRDVRRIRASGMRCTISHDLAAFEQFYDGFYCPFARARFGHQAVIRRRSVLRRLFRQGGVLWVWRGGRCIAGQLFQVENFTLRLIASGALSVDYLRRNRLVSAKTVLAIDYARAQGLLALDLGGALPSLRDGVLAHKRGWGACLVDRSTSHHDVLVRWTHFNGSVARFLEDVPLIFRDRAGFAAVSAVATGGAGVAAAGSEVWNRYAPPGLDRLYVIGAESSSTPPPETLSHPQPAKVWLAGRGPPEIILGSARPCVS